MHKVEWVPALDNVDGASLEGRVHWLAPEAEMYNSELRIKALEALLHWVSGVFCGAEDLYIVFLKMLTLLT